MDGVIIDTEPLHAIADNRILQDSGITAPEGYFERYAGWTSQAMWEEIRKDYRLPGSVEEIVKLQLPLKLDLLREGDYGPIPGVIGLMQKIRELGLPMAIASSSPVQFIEAVVQKLGLKEYVTFWLSGEDVARSKPDPDIFLRVAEELNVGPSDCLVIEDSSSGIIAAKRAGMKCIGYRNHNSGNQDLSEADFIVGDLNEIDIRDLI